MVVLALVFFVVGVVLFTKKNKKAVIVFLALLAMAFIAAGFEKYLLGGRFSLFMVPAVLVCVVWGIEGVNKRCGRKGIVVFWLCVAVFFAGTIPPTWNHFVRGRKKEETREFARHIQEYFQEGDVLMANDAGTVALWYYFGQNGAFQIPRVILISDAVIDNRGHPEILIAKRIFDFDDNGYYYGVKEFNQARRLDFISDLDIGKYKRIWFFGGHLKGAETFVLEYFERRGSRPDIYKKKPGAVLMMFEKKIENGT